MYNTQDYYNAEMAYRRQQARLDSRPLFLRRRTRSVRNEAPDHGTGSAA